ncbi:hypothetical protein D8L93_09545 [Sodalis-like symbiont of Bactericera trigonica]|nr:hypothetical protein D8L93_09545 [Sodalis-like symbiont of Bactericera trigonica]
MGGGRLARQRKTALIVNAYRKSLQPPAVPRWCFTVSPALTVQVNSNNPDKSIPQAFIDISVMYDDWRR